MMVDLKRPLEGVRGLLLMAALVFFGATVGVAVALACSWVELKDSLANFLGGVVGAGLGAALAVMGAVYAQRRERREQLSASVHALIGRLENLERYLSFLSGGLERPDKEAFGDEGPSSTVVKIIGQLQRQAEDFPRFDEISREWSFRIGDLKFMLEEHLAEVLREVTNRAQPKQTVRYDRALIAAEPLISQVGDLLPEAYKLLD